MAEFSFGQRRKAAGRHRDRLVGDLTLHVQCAWRIVVAQLTSTGWRDLYLRPDGTGQRASDEEIEAHTTRLDRRLAELFDGSPGFTVVSADLGPGRSLVVRASDELRLEIMPSDSTKGQQWRIFAFEEDGPYAVVLGTGPESDTPE